MTGSNFSIINGSDGVMKVPISTPANDANGNTVVGHLVMTAISGVATPVDATHPLSINAAALPLPAGAATDASLTGLATTLGKIQTILTTPPLPAGAATDTTLGKLLPALTQIETTLTAPPLPTGAATEATLGKLGTALTQIETTLTTPPLPAGAATEATLGKLLPALTQIETTLTTPPLAAGAATDASLGKLATALAQIETTLTAPPLPAGAATNASLGTLATALAGLQTTLTALQQTEAPFQGVVPMTLDQAQATQRAVRIVCTTTGNVSLTYTDGSKDVIPIAVGLSYIAGAVTTVNSAGTTAVATYANMR